MNWGSLSDFWHMGGYAWYVWGAYGVTVVLVAAEIVALRARHKRAVQEVARQARGRVEG